MNSFFSCALILLALCDWWRTSVCDLYTDIFFCTDFWLQNVNDSVENKTKVGINRLLLCHFLHIFLLLRFFPRFQFLQIRGLN